jgi:hypothetical protein
VPVLIKVLAPLKKVARPGFAGSPRSMHCR